MSAANLSKLQSSAAGACLAATRSEIFNDVIMPASRVWRCRTTAGTIP